MESSETVEVVASAVASKTTYAGGAASVFGMMMSIDLISWIGLSVAIGGFLMNWYYKRKEDSRSEELHKIRIKELQCNGDCRNVEK